MHSVKPYERQVPVLWIPGSGAEIDAIVIARSVLTRELKKVDYPRSNVRFDHDNGPALGCLAKTVR